MREDAVEAVGPECAIAAAGTHIVNDGQELLVAEQLGQANSALGGREIVVANLLGFDRLLKLP